MKTAALFLVAFGSFFACKTQTTVAPEQFYFKTVTVNDQQSGGFYANNTNLTPKIEISFSAPLNTATAQSAISLVERQSSTKVPLNLTFFNADSAVRLVPQQPLKSITQYNILVNPELESKQKTPLNSNINFGLITALDTADKFPRISDEELLTLVQKQTFRYFWDFGHPVSGLSRERNTSGDVCTSGGTGFGIMAMVVAAERGFVTRSQVVERLTKMTDFLKNKAKSYHGVFPHWFNGTTGETIPFSANDNGADLVETSYLMQGLLTARQYFDKNTPEETALRKTINDLWTAVEWDWHTKGGEKVLYCHWSPNLEWKKNHQIHGWN